MTGNYFANRLYRLPAFIAREIEQLLATCGLTLEDGVSQFIEVRQAGLLVACAGLSGNIIKCVAISPAHRGQALSQLLLTEVMKMAFQQGNHHLFVYTRPENIPAFSGCGFTPLVTVPQQVTLMENSATRLRQYCDSLAQYRHSGDITGGIVLNANPFTLGHRYLIEQAAACCDWLHVFVVKEDAACFPFPDRLALIQAGVADIVNVTVHPGSDYIISKVTFPAYFLKNRGIIDECHTALDLMLFRHHIAPALGINCRFVGSEPFDAVTAKYNQDMRYWLSLENTEVPAIRTVEIPRKEISGIPVSASRVRTLLDKGMFDALRELVPDTTFRYLLHHSSTPLPAYSVQEVTPCLKQ